MSVLLLFIDNITDHRQNGSITQLTMSEEQLKAEAEAEADKPNDGLHDLQEEDLEAVTGGHNSKLSRDRAIASLKRDPFEDLFD